MFYLGIRRLNNTTNRRIMKYSLSEIARLLFHIAVLTHRVDTIHISVCGNVCVSYAKYGPLEMEK